MDELGIDNNARSVTLLQSGALRRSVIIHQTVQNSHLQVPPACRLSTVNNRTYTIAGPHVWNTAGRDNDISATFDLCQRLKTWLFRKSSKPAYHCQFTVNVDVALLGKC